MHVHNQSEMPAYEDMQQTVYEEDDDTTEMQSMGPNNSSQANTGNASGETKKNEKRVLSRIKKNDPVPPCFFVPCVRGGGGMSSFLPWLIDVIYFAVAGLFLRRRITGIPLTLT